MSERTRPERRRATRSASRKAQTQSRPAPPRRPAAKQSRPAARPRGAGFLDYLIISLLVVLVLMIIAGVLIVLHGGL